VCQSCAHTQTPTFTALRSQTTSIRQHTSAYVSIRQHTHTAQSRCGGVREFYSRIHLFLNLFPSAIHLCSTYLTHLFLTYLFFFPCHHAQLEKVRAELANANAQLATARAAAGTEDTYVVGLSGTEDTYIVVLSGHCKSCSRY
jgi:hypothetical protein